MGVDVLREAVARRYRERGVPTTRDQILVTGGAQSALHLLLDALVGPGDRVVVEHPTYPHAITAIRAVGARPVPVPVGPDGTDLDLLESTIRQVSPRLVYLIPDYQNPTGTSLSDAGRARIREMAVRHRTVIIGDEALSDLTLDGAAPTPFAGGGTESGVVVSVGSASKAFWGGLRVGWMRAHPDLITRLSLTRAHVDLGTAVLEQLVTAHLLDRHDEILPERRSMLRERRDQVLALLADQLPEWTVPRPAGGLFLWADLGVPVSSALTALALRHGARLIPGPAFGVDGSFERFLRVPFTETPEVLTRGIRAVSASWSVLDPTATPATAYPTRAFV
ncbi:PLP-dependent aminotransferase family protein [Cellulomonas sp. P24]|uniref:aminotransferase-like domain-containing protein n=1 Tax=Cellulomonas sp. P24 TaxID=2885206 RepID=UPI00216AD1BC|nr:PLP-dependent aminotransferase family protein [Cellulomonas sp. P24]MCR6494194.1 PLP-dependent aminotransferase family protein [Cellulomonas sp. P24]